MTISSLENFKLEGYRGDTYERPFDVVDADLNPINTSTWTLYFTLRKKARETGENTDVTPSPALIHKEISATDATLGEYNLFIDFDEAEIRPGSYFYDIQAVVPGSPKRKVYTVAPGTFIISGESTGTNTL